MASTFPGFSPKALSFFRQLNKNNKREWFQPRKQIFEDLLKTPMTELVSQICDDLRKFAVDYVIEPRKAIYRIHRDTRFSKDKTPYKTFIAAMFPRTGMPKHAGGEYYFSVSYDAVAVAVGMYMPGPEQLTAVRDAIARDHKKFRATMAGRQIAKLMGELQGNRLTRTPRGISPDHPAADLLPMKQFYFVQNLDPSVALGKSIRKEVVDRFRVMSPFVNFINNAALAALKLEEGADDRPIRPAPMF